MPDTNPIEFTEREKFILSYYRDAQLSNPKRHLSYDLSVVAASLFCVIIAITREEFVFGLAGYAILLWRLCQTALTGSRWTKDFQSIFTKYDAKMKAATEAQKMERRNDVA